MYHLQIKDSLQNTCFFSNKHYSLNAGMHQFENKAAKKEMNQLHIREVFKPVKREELNTEEKIEPWKVLFSWWKRCRNN